MTHKVFLKHPWYDPDGAYRRTEANPRSVEFDLALLPSTAEVEPEGGKRGDRKKVWELRGESDPATRSDVLKAEQEATKLVPLAKALQGSGGSGAADAKLKAENDDLRKKIAALEAAAKK